MRQCIAIPSVVVICVIVFLSSPSYGVTVYADEWGSGFDPNDSWLTLKGAIESGADTVVVRDMGSPWVTRHLYFQNNQRIVLEPGVVLWAKQGEMLSTGASMFRGIDDCNVILEGYGATVRMRKEDYMDANQYTLSQQRHVIALANCTNVTIKGLTLENSGGDGIKIAGTGDGCSNIHVKDVVSNENLRCGISLMNCSDVLIEDSIFKNTGGIQQVPHDGIHFEPFGTDEINLSNVVIRNCEVNDNEQSGIRMGFSAVSGATQDISVTIQDCKVSGGETGLSIRNFKQDSPNGLIAFENILVEDTASTGLYITDKSSKAALWTFTNITLKDVATDGANPLIINGQDFLSGDEPGGMEFDGCQIFDDQYRPAVKVAGQYNTMGLWDTNGTIYADNPAGVWGEIYAPRHDSDLSVVNGVIFPDGDASLDRKVGAADLALLAANWGTSGRWYDGDFSLDGNIGAADLALLAGNWGYDGSGGTAPEPATLSLLCLGGMLFLKKRT